MGTCTICRQDGCPKSRGRANRTRPLEALPGLQRRRCATPACSCRLPRAGPPALGLPSSTPRWWWTLNQSPRLWTQSRSSTPQCVPRPAEPGLPSQTRLMPTASPCPADGAWQWGHARPAPPITEAPGTLFGVCLFPSHPRGQPAAAQSEVTIYPEPPTYAVREASQGTAQQALASRGRSSKGSGPNPTFLPIPLSPKVPGTHFLLLPNQPEPPHPLPQRLPDTRCLLRHRKWAASREG